MLAPEPRLPPAFFVRDALTVARDLLGHTLVHRWKGKRRAGRIVETEAYVGAHDLACHSSKGLTRRTEPMFGPPGRAYVYLIYGMHHCFNVVVEPEGVAAAVLVRGLEPLEGVDPELRTDGPGKLCKALRITLTQNRVDLRGDDLYLLPGAPVADAEVAKGRRIGVDYAGAWADEPFRLWIRGNPHVSRPRKEL